MGALAPSRLYSSAVAHEHKSRPVKWMTCSWVFHDFQRGLAQRFSLRRFRGAGAR